MESLVSEAKRQRLTPLTMSRVVTDSVLSASILGEAEKQLVNSR